MRSKLVDQRVRKLLSEDEKFRNSDKALFLEYLERYDGLRLSPEQKALFMKATPFESISRRRRALREEYPGNEQVENARYNLFVETKGDYGEPIIIFKQGVK